MIRLSILDQSLIPKGGSARETLRDTVELARVAEQLGYQRFWVSEHHMGSIAHSSPEVFLAYIGSQTSTIRIGSGGVMLPHYSAYKVAEQFRLLEALFPGRIDLGVGRAPGGMPLTTWALQEYKHMPDTAYQQQIRDLVHYLTGSKDPHHRFPGLVAVPDIPSHPEIWVLGSSGGSAVLAAEEGVSFAHAQFISGVKDIEAIKLYQSKFTPSAIQNTPQTLVALFVACAETDEKAEQLAAVLDLALLNIERGKVTEGVPTIEEALREQYSPVELRHIRQNRSRMLVGSPDSIKRQIEQLSKEYQTEEFMLATVLPDLKTKVNVFTLLAEAFDLKE